MLNIFITYRNTSGLAYVYDMCVCTHVVKMQFYLFQKQQNSNISWSKGEKIVALGHLGSNVQLILKHFDASSLATVVQQIPAGRRFSK